MNVPDVVQDLLLRNTVIGAVFFVIGVTMTVCYFITLKIFFIKSKSGYIDDYTLRISLLFLLFGGPVAVFVIFGGLDWLQIMVAPKLYLIEYASKLVN